MRLPYWAVGAIFLSLAANPLDLASYCKGWCKARYQDGIFGGSRGCACIDYFPINLSRRIEVPKKVKKPNDIPEPHAYDGVDEMHFSPSE